MMGIRTRQDGSKSACDAADACYTFIITHQCMSFTWITAANTTTVLAASITCMIDNLDDFGKHTHFWDLSVSKSLSNLFLCRSLLVRTCSTNMHPNIYSKNYQHMCLKLGTRL